MNEVTITVRGEHQTRVTPERAKVHLSVGLDGPDRQRVLDAVGQAATPVRESLTARSDAGTLVEWSSTAISVRAERPWNPEGKRLAPSTTQRSLSPRPSPTSRNRRCGSTRCPCARA